MSGVPDVEQVMRHPATLRQRQFRGADVHAAVELHRIGVDDLAAEPPGKFHTQVALAGRGGTDDSDDTGHGVAVLDQVATR